MERNITRFRRVDENSQLTESATWERTLSADEVKALASGISPLLLPESLVMYINAEKGA